uniref:CSON012714 protein n=1 Tax=Culicoides sonorensis TaxID=179676 RepID=A0A336KLN0_CULSO
MSSSSFSSSPPRPFLESHLSSRILESSGNPARIFRRATRSRSSSPSPRLAASASCFFKCRSRFVCCPKQRSHNAHLKGRSLFDKYSPNTKGCNDGGGNKAWLCVGSPGILKSSLTVSNNRYLETYKYT